ncbi:TetR/AcrR family transcriptional regulator [Metabacillus sp. FJAT-53654]|uniref:TetR/AcrR family transcriptional regulator n=1 Tax=Metabacillus rhizosphaerae TaxID=3117747 RepID=A0ABZ2MXB8_9BACI
MMSSNEIKKYALHHFASSGYDGTSLSAIASDVGIKKQSIYAHFANKDDLFLKIMEEVLVQETSYIKSFFSKNNTLALEKKLFQFLQEYSKRYESQAETRFLLRIGFLPPTHLHQQVIASLYKYYDELEGILIEIFTNHKDSILTPVNEAVIAFIGLTDSVLVELLYSGNDRFQRRLNACWKVYWQGIRSKEE